MSPSLDRRRFLASSALAGIAGLAGCTGGDNPVYSLSPYRLDGQSLRDAFAWRPPEYSAWSDSVLRSLLNRLLRTGSLTTRNLQLVLRGSVGGDTFTEPRFAERDDDYHRLLLTDVREVTTDGWVVWFDRIDGKPPADATVVSELPTDLSAHDRELLGGALAIVADDGATRDIESEPLPERGSDYVWRPDRSDVVPDPPFAYFEYERSDEPSVHFRLRVEPTGLSATEYVHETERVARSPTEYERYLRENVVRTTFGGDATDDVAAIVTELTRRRSYRERAPLSEAYETVLKRLGLDGLTAPGPNDAPATHGPVYFGSDGDWYETELTVDYRPG